MDTSILRSMLFVCIVLIGGLVMLGGQSHKPAALPLPIGDQPIPTAQVLNQSETVPVALPLPTATPVPVETTTDASTVAAPALASSEPVHNTGAAPMVRTGPGGLSYPLGLAHLNLGVVGELYQTDRETALHMTHDVGFQWLRQHIRWSTIETAPGVYAWDELDALVADAERHGVWLLVSITAAPSWVTADTRHGLPADPATLAHFVGLLTERYQGRIHALEIWNGQNLAREYGGNVTLEDAGSYVELLAACYQQIKNIDPQMIVVAGALSPTSTYDPAVAMPDIDYLRAMYQYNQGMMRNYFDVQGVEVNGTWHSPDAHWTDQPDQTGGWTNDSTFYFRHLERIYEVMQEAGVHQHQVWITAYGWATRNTTPGYEFGNEVTLEQQRHYSVRAIERTYEYYPWVSNMFLWNLNSSVVQQQQGLEPLHQEGSYSIVNADWTVRPAYQGIKDMIAKVRIAQGNW
ncbi:MAG: hypothetical protein HC837_06900 [Chloroflexaceae bacterium]|nr:hypothetical protein [Chloroflexaceae bacterium]